MAANKTSERQSSHTPVLLADVPAISPIPKRKTIRNQVVERITDLIISGALPAGTRLTELGVASMLGVSRVPVREAFLILQSDQWIDSRESQGTTVHVPRPNEVKDIFEVRMAIEAEAALLAARRGAKGCGTLLQLAHEGKDAMVSDKPFDRKALSDINERFHNQIGHLSGNPILTKIIDLLDKKTQMYFTLNIANPRGAQAWDEHIAIAEAIGGGDSQTAAQLMRDHIETSWQHFEETSSAEAAPTASIG